MHDHLFILLLFISEIMQKSFFIIGMVLNLIENNFSQLKFPT